MDCEPLSALLPLQPPEAVQALAFVADQVSVELVPIVTELGAALSVTAGALLETVTVADCVADPPAPVQVSSYSVLLVSVPVDIVPLVGTLPCQPPEAVQAAVPEDFQVSAELPPLATVVGAALKVTEAATGAGTATTDTATD